jgi:hypothetical protein
MRRFDLEYCDGESGKCEAYMCPDSTGDYVLFTDVGKQVWTVDVKAGDNDWATWKIFSSYKAAQQYLDKCAASMEYLKARGQITHWEVNDES